jgi:hypothetical protein
MDKIGIKAKKTCFLAVVVAPIWCLAVAMSAAYAPQLLLTGTFHGNEVAAQSGEKWLALVPSGKGYALEETRIRIERVKDELLDEDGETTGKKVSVDLDKKPIFLVRGIQRLTPGKVETAIPRKPDFEVNQTIQVTLSNGRIFDLMVACDQTTPLTVDNFRECPLLLSHESKTQKIRSFQVYFSPNSKPVFASDANPSLIWAGDLDKDGSLDLLLDLSNHYNVSAPTLFLSSEARSDELVVKVAEFMIYGC